MELKQGSGKQVGLPLTGRPCYGHRLKQSTPLDILPVSLSNRKTALCHEHSYKGLFLTCFLALWVLVAPVLGQPSPIHPLRSGAPAQDEIVIHAVSQKQDGEMIYLKGDCRIETTETLVKADEIDYNRDTHWAEARGHVHFENFVNGDKLEAARRLGIGKTTLYRKLKDYAAHALAV